ncbi:MAG TPA: uroporphyrinogen-III synthase [Frankiaceae bacterium]|nr:uroporphyrinogen-III synthase [Frankiaceae bacterium]
MDAPVEQEAVLPLAGFTVATTAERRRDELISLLQRRGARVVSAPTLRLIPLADDDELFAATRMCIEQPLDLVLITTGIGLRSWLEAADGWGVGDGLRRRLAATEILARGPKARGAIRAAGLVETWSPASEAVAEMVDHVLAQDVDGKRVAVQLHGEPLPELVAALRTAGATVVEVPVYRWLPAADLAPVRRLVDQIIHVAVDGVVFTSGPAVTSLLDRAAEMGRRDELLAALQTDVVAFCIGPVTGARLERHDVPTLQPERSRLGALVREVVTGLPELKSRTLPIAGARVELRGHAVVVERDGRPVLVPLAPAPMAVLRALAERPGRVLSRAELLGALPTSESKPTCESKPISESNRRPDEHAVEVAIARLRAALKPLDAVQTVVKRGYRLVHEPEPAPVPA